MVKQWEARVDGVFVGFVEKVVNVMEYQAFSANGSLVGVEETLAAAKKHVLAAVAA